MAVTRAGPVVTGRAVLDQRQFSALLEREGELVRVAKRVDWDLELGAITRLACERQLPAILFENIKDYPGGKVLWGELGPTRPVVQGRVALALGMSKTTPWRDIVEETIRRMEHPIAPVVVDDGPCKENVVLGDDIDLLRFPVPWIHGVDGGRFIGTWHINVTQDPASGWVNWGMYRMMVQGPRQVGLRLQPRGQHGGRIFYQHFVSAKKPMPVAIAIGADPLCTMAAAMPLPPERAEVEIAGALRQAPVELVRCETVPLMVPASAEIVIEGWVDPDARAFEGPFGEYLGYCAGSKASMPFVNVTAVTHRTDPVLAITNLGKLWDENATVQSVGVSALMTRYLRDEGIDVKSAFEVPQAVVVSAKARPGLAKAVLDAFQKAKSQSRFGSGGPVIILVEDDVQPTDLRDLWWALTTRLHPVNGVHVAETLPRPLQPFLSPEDREQGNNWFILFDLTFPADWPADYRRDHTRTVTFESAYPEDLQRNVLARWAELGLPPLGEPTRASGEV